MANGIPVLASNRGALPETVGLKKGDRHLRRMVLQMPLTRVPGASPHFFRAMEGCSSTSRLATRPTRGSCPVPRRSSRGWRRSCACGMTRGFTASKAKRLARAAQWHPDRLRPLYVEFFRNVSRSQNRRWCGEWRWVARPSASAGAGCQPAGNSADWQSAPQCGDCRFREGVCLAGREARGPPFPPRDWLVAGTQELLARSASPTTRLVVEVGSWLGRSTRFLAGRAPNAHIVAIDHWLGSAEHRQDAELAPWLPQLYETFLAECWDYRHQIIPVRANSLEGMRRVAEAGLEPDLVYIDADHSFHAVYADVTAALDLFPQATIVGDDWDWESVRSAVLRILADRRLSCERLDNGWRIVRKTQAPPRTPEGGMSLSEAKGVAEGRSSQCEAPNPKQISRTQGLKFKTEGDTAVR